MKQHSTTETFDHAFEQLRVQEHLLTREEIEGHPTIRVTFDLGEFVKRAKAAGAVIKREEDEHPDRRPLPSRP